MKTAISLLLLLSVSIARAEKGANAPGYCDPDRVTATAKAKKDGEDTYITFCLPKEGFTKGFEVKGLAKDATITNGWPGPATQSAGVAPFGKEIKITYNDEPGLRFTVKEFKKDKDGKKLPDKISFVLKKGGDVEKTLTVNLAFDIKMGRLASGEFLIEVSAEKGCNADEELACEGDVADDPYLNQVIRDDLATPLPSPLLNEPVPQMQPAIPFDPAPDASVPILEPESK